jgi:hypothetical protein
MELRYAKLMTERGCLRIGTLDDFRTAEHFSGIADDQEGKKTTKVNIKHKSYKSGSDVAKSLAVLGLVAADETDRNITLENVHTITEHVAPDCYIWCSSSVKSSETMSEFEGADTCVEIHDTKGFFTALSRILKIHRCYFEGVFTVKYGEKTELWNLVELGTHPALLKPTNFKMQNEQRGVWSPMHDMTIKPILVQDVELARCCRIVMP